MVGTINNGSNSATFQKYSWNEFVDALSKQVFEYPELKIAYLAQCILESGSGASKLFREAGNPTGIKWRPEMEIVAQQTWLETPTEPEGTFWCSWDTAEAAIHGYLKFIARDRYRGWERFGSDPKGYINHLVQHGYATDPNYVAKVTSLFPEAKKLLGVLTEESSLTSEVATWLKVDIAPDNEPTIYAMTDNLRLSSLKSTSAQEVCDYLLKHQEARTVRLSQQVKALEDTELLSISKNINPQATWFQFWRIAGSETALLGMQAGNAVDALVSNNKDEIVKFIKSHSKANTVQAANLNSPPVKPLPQKPTGSSHTTRAATLKPYIEWISGCRNFSSRNGKAIDSIVVHYTTSRSVNGTISWFSNPASKLSAHYIVDRDGKIYQMVKDSDKAWHCRGFNTTSIGIEHVAEKGDRLTPAQEEASAALIRWLSSEYELSPEQIFGHRWNPGEPGGTPCPGSLWSSQEELRAWLERKVFNSLQQRQPQQVESTRGPALESPPTVRTVSKLQANSPFELWVTPHIQYGEICKWEDRRRFFNQQQCNVAIIICQFLEKVRTAFDDRPLIITSGHRPHPINEQQGGAANSEHLYEGSKGAIDFYIEGVDIYKVQDYCRTNWPHSVGLGAPRGFVHIGYGRGNVVWDY